MRAALFPALALVGCGPAVEAPVAADTNQIERLSTPVGAGPAPADPAQLVPLSATDVSPDQAICRFAVADQILVAAGGGGATVRTPFGLRHLVASGPVAGTGGYFEDRQLSISIGRDRSVAGPKPAGGAAPARMTVTNRRMGTEHRVSGQWGCTG